MLQLLKDNGPWDGVLLAQHGAAVSDEFPDADGEVAQRVRKLVGPNVPIGMALDLHANLSQKMLNNSTAMVLYRTNPHLDARPRAVECAEIIIRTINGEIFPKQALETPPMLINIIKLLHRLQRYFAGQNIDLLVSYSAMRPYLVLINVPPFLLALTNRIIIQY